MQAKTEKELLKEGCFIQNQRTLNYWAGKDVILAWVSHGDYEEAYSIGTSCVYDCCRSFIVDRLCTLTAEKASDEMGFSSPEEMYAWLFENGQDMKEF